MNKPDTAEQNIEQAETREQTWNGGNTWKSFKTTEEAQICWLLIEIRDFIDKCMGFL